MASEAGRVRICEDNFSLAQFFDFVCDIRKDDIYIKFLCDIMFIQSARRKNTFLYKIVVVHKSLSLDYSCLAN